MRTLILMALLSAGFSSSAQEPWHLWAHHESAQLSSFLQTHADSLQRYTDWGMEPLDLRRAFHLMDLDADGDLDAIYTGWSGAEGTKIQFYLNAKGALQEGPLLMGEIQEVFGTESRFFLKSIEPPCCGDVEDNLVLTEFRIFPDSISCIEIDRKVRAVEGQHPTWFFPKPIPFEVLAERYHLRISPVIDTTFYAYREFQNGNIYLTFQQGATGVATSMHEDATGRVWWYVIMDPQAGVSDFRFCGWMSNRFLQTTTYDRKTK